MKNNTKFSVLFPVTHDRGSGQVPERPELLDSTADACKEIFPDPESYVQALVEAIPTPMAVKGVDGKYKLCNQMFANIVGRKREEVVGKTVFDLFPPDLAHDSEAQDRALLECDNVSFSEPSIAHGDKGAKRHFIMQKTALKDDAGKSRGIIGAGIEITARKRMEEAINHLAQGVSAYTGREFLHRLAQLLAETLGAEHVAISCYDSKKGSAGQQLAVFSRGKFKKQFECELKDPVCWDIISRGGFCRPGEEATSFCKQCLLAGVGTEGFIGTTLYDQDGKIVGAISVVDEKNDIRSEFAADILKIFAARASGEIQRLKAEEEIVRTRDFHMNMLSSIPAMTWRTDASGRHDYFNDTWLEFTGLTLEEAMQKPCSDLVHPEDQQRFVEAFENSFRVQLPFQVECRVRRYDGDYRWILTEGRPFYGSDNAFAGYIGSCLDITDRKTSEDHLRHVQRMEALGKLSGGIAHEFNNILAVIEGHAALLKLRRPEDAPLLKALDAILDASGRASHLTNSMMAYTQKQLSAPEATDISQIVYDLKTLLSNLIRKDLTLEVDLAPQRLPVCVDVGQIEQVLINLAANARDALSSGGTLAVRTGRVDRLPPNIDQVGTMPSRGYAVLTVSDDGCGISPQDLERMYEPYFSTKEVGKGTGLGLSVAYGIVAQHGGHISCESVVGSGTTFTLYFPLSDEADISFDDVPGSWDVAAGSDSQLSGPPVVLLADDDVMVREVLQEILESDGYQVMSAADGDEALEIYHSHSDRIGLVALDFNMPKKNGAQVVAELGLTQRDVPVLLMTGDVNDALASEFEQAKDVVLLSKPFPPATLLSKVKELIDEKRR